MKFCLPSFRWSLGEFLVWILTMGNKSPKLSRPKFCHGHLRGSGGVCLCRNACFLSRIWRAWPRLLIGCPQGCPKPSSLSWCSVHSYKALSFCLRMKAPSCSEDSLGNLRTFLCYRKHLGSFHSILLILKEDCPSLGSPAQTSPFPLRSPGNYCQHRQN